PRTLPERFFRDKTRLRSIPVAKRRRGEPRSNASPVSRERGQRHAGHAWMRQGQSDERLQEERVQFPRLGRCARNVHVTTWLATSWSLPAPEVTAAVESRGADS